MPLDLAWPEGVIHQVPYGVFQRADVLAREQARIFRGDTREHWVARFAGRDACVTAVHTFAEAAASPELRARSTFVDWDGVRQPAPAPRLEASPATARPRSGWSSHTDEILRELAIDAERGPPEAVVETLRIAVAAGRPPQSVTADPAAVLRRGPWHLLRTGRAHDGNRARAVRASPSPAAGRGELKSAGPLSPRHGQGGL